MKQLDVAIIGAGTAGISARAEVKKQTQNYMVFDGGVLGTTCARVGCMPSKVLIQAANDFYHRKLFAQQGIMGSDALRVDIEKTFAHVRSLRDRFVGGVHKDMEKWQHEHLQKTFVSFVDAHTLQTADGQRYRAKKIILATGSSPFYPKEFEGLGDAVVTTDDFFELTQVPKRWLVVGTGVIGMELGQALARLGRSVTAVGRKQALAGITDPEVLGYTVQAMKQELDVRFGKIEKVHNVQDHLEITIDGQVLQVDKVLLAAGRRPNLHTLTLENAGVTLGEKHVPDYDATSMLIDGTDHIFIAGDVNGDRGILHESSDEGRIAGFNSVAADVTCFRRRTPLGITFTDPNIAYAGLTYRELADSGQKITIGKVSFERQGRSIIKGQNKGLLHIYADEKTGEVLGAELFAPDGEHLAHMLSWAIGEKATVDHLLTKPFYHPVVQEGLRTALRSIKQGLLNIEIPPIDG